MSTAANSTTEGRRKRWRAAVLVALLVVELTLLKLLPERGWFETLDFIRWIVAGVAFCLPCLLAVGLLGLRRGRFGLQAMLAATGLIAVFLALFVLPYTHARDGRLTTQLLKQRNIGLSTESYLDAYYQSLESSGVKEEGPLRKVELASETPSWIEPLLSGLPTLEADRVQGLEIWHDEQIPVILELQDKLTSLRSILLFGQKGSATCVTEVGLEKLSKGLSEIEALSIIDVAIPEDCCRSFAGVRHLSIVAHDSTSPVFHLSESQLHDIASTPGLEILYLYQCDLDDDGAAILAKAAGLRHLDLRRTRVTAAGRARIEKEYSRLKIHFRR